MYATMTGDKALMKKFGSLIEIIDDKQMETALMKPAGDLRNAIKTAAPRGPTGNLKRSIMAKKFKRKIKGAPAVFVAIDRKIAPHAHLVEYGHAGPHPAPAHPFFRPTVDGKHADIGSQIEKEVRTVIEKEAKKRR